MWRNSAGVLLCAPANTFRTNHKNMWMKEKMEILFVKRSEKAGFMANVQAFPGGVLDKADYSSKWLGVFNLHEKRSFFPRLGKHPKLPIYAAWRKKAEVAYRICAIRELFEETGVLLAYKKSNLNHGSATAYGSMLTLHDDIACKWRKIVHDNALNFIEMCRELNCVPDIFSMMEWSNWLTPFNSKRRYDTVFYLVFLNNKPCATPDLNEISGLIWSTPQNMIDLQFQRQLMVAPPQYCDLSLLCKFNDLKLLYSFVKRPPFIQRNVMIRIRDCMGHGHLAVGLGDDLYPSGDQSVFPSNGFTYSVKISNEMIILNCSHAANFEYYCASHSARELYLLCSRLNRVYGSFSGMIHHNSTSVF